MCRFQLLREHRLELEIFGLDRDSDGICVLAQLAFHDESGMIEANQESAPGFPDGIAGRIEILGSHASGPRRFSRTGLAAA